MGDGHAGVSVQWRGDVEVLAVRDEAQQREDRGELSGALGGWLRRYASRMEWTPPRIRLFRDVGLCQSQHDFAKTLGVAKRTIGNAERGVHPPNLALRRALDQVLEHASDIQRDRFLAAITTEDQSIAFLVHGTTPAVDFPVTSYVDTAYCTSKRYSNTFGTLLN
jgi:DNA-binding XRE family transcriptional regulator